MNETLIRFGWPFSPPFRPRWAERSNRQIFFGLQHRAELVGTPRLPQCNFTCQTRKLHAP